jgi:hypothetical protein
MSLIPPQPWYLLSLSFSAMRYTALMYIIKPSAIASCTSLCTNQLTHSLTHSPCHSLPSALLILPNQPTNARINRNCVLLCIHCTTHSLTHSHMPRLRRIAHQETRSFSRYRFPRTSSTNAAVVASKSYRKSIGTQVIPRTIAPGFDWTPMSVVAAVRAYLVYPLATCVLHGAR